MRSTSPICTFQNQISHDSAVNRIMCARQKLYECVKFTKKCCITSLVYYISLFITCMYVSPCACECMYA